MENILSKKKASYHENNTKFHKNPIVNNRSESKDFGGLK